MTNKINDQSNYPSHVAIIMDGNGRWAQQKNLPRIKGHQAGAKATKKIIEAAQQHGIKYLSLFAFSVENWKRPEKEVMGLMNLLRRYLKSDVSELHKRGAKVKVIGDKAMLDADILEQINHVEVLTQNNETITIQIALSYGGQQEILSATQQLARDVQEGKISPEEIHKDLFETYLMTTEVPAPDLLIRTSGERRISNFMLWQLAYSELYFSDLHWPDFKPVHVIEALNEYSNRQRRFGQLIDQSRQTKQPIKIESSI